MDLAYILRRIDTGSHLDPDREALVFEDQRLTYRQLKARAERLLGSLRALGLAKGDRVAVLMKNRVEWFDVLFAAAAAGAVMVPINYLLKTAEISFILADSGARFLFVEEDLLPLFEPVRAEYAASLTPICVGGEAPAGYCGFDSLPAGEPGLGPPVASLDDIFLIQYTSGTTGLPKGATHTHGSLLWNTFHQIPDFNITDEERYLCVPALCWVAGLHDFTLGTLWQGGTVVLYPSRALQVEHLVDTVEQERVTKALLVPTILKRLLDYPELPQRDFRSFNAILTGAEPVPVPVIKRFNELLPYVTLLQGYGLSEGPTIALYLKKKDALRKVGSAGKPSLNCELQVVDEQLNRVPPGEVGEVVLRSPGTMIGYWNKPEANADVFAGGWLHTGDLAVYDEEGYIYIRGRKKDMYISGGLNVYPTEIENVILKDQRVAEAAVIGIPDEAWGEVGCAVVCLHQAGSMTEADVKALCRDSLANYKVPKRVVFRGRPLTRTASGKILKRVIREEEGLPAL